MSERVTEAERNYETMRMATREVQAATEKAAGELAKAVADRDEWRALARELGEFITHTEGCPADWHKSISCYCGYGALVDKLREKEEQE